MSKYDPIEQMFGKRFPCSVFDDDIEYPGLLSYMGCDEDEWVEVQKHFANTYEPWDIHEGDYWVFFKFRAAKKGSCYRHEESNV